MTDRPNNQDAGITEPMHPSDDELSAYLNRDTADLATRRRLEAHLESCVECRERLAELRTVVRLLHGLENPVPKRSFRLDPSMVSAPLPEPLRIDPWIVRVQPALRRLTAIAAVLLVLLVTADVLTHRGSPPSGQRETSEFSSASQARDSTSVMSAGAAESASKSTAAAAQVPASTAAATAASSSGGSSSAGSSAETPVTTSAAGGGQAVATAVSGSAAADAARSDEEVAPEASAAALSVQPTEASGQPPAEAAPASNGSPHDGRSYWRLVELAVGVVVIWLLFLTVVLPRLPHRRRS